MFFFPCSSSSWVPLNTLKIASEFPVDLRIGFLKMAKVFLEWIFIIFWYRTTIKAKFLLNFWFSLSLSLSLLLLKRKTYCGEVKGVCTKPSADQKKKKKHSRSVLAFKQSVFSPKFTVIFFNIITLRRFP